MRHPADPGRVGTEAERAVGRSVNHVACGWQVGGGREDEAAHTLLATEPAGRYIYSVSAMYLAVGHP